MNYTNLTHGKYGALFCASVSISVCFRAGDVASVCREKHFTEAINSFLKVLKILPLQICNSQ
jgi:hypothetical protein